MACFGQYLAIQSFRDRVPVTGRHSYAQSVPPEIGAT